MAINKDKTGKANISTNQNSLLKSQIKTSNEPKKTGGRLKAEEMVNYNEVTDYASTETEITKISEALGISRKTFYNLLARDEKFKGAYEAGVNNRKYQLEQALYRRATGYAAEEKQTVTDAEGNVIKKTVTEKSYVPDTTALIFALSNRFPERYKDVKEIKQTTNININVRDIQKLTDEELSNYIEIPDTQYKIE